MSTVSLLLVDDDAAFRGVLAGELRRRPYDVVAVASGDDAKREAAASQPQVVLLDLRLPDLSGLDVLRFIREASPTSEVIVLTGHGSIDTAIESIRMGAFDYVTKPCPLDELEMRIQRAVERQALQKRATLLDRVLTPPDPGPSFIGESPPFRDVLRLIDRVAPSDSTVLITGETGTGKEMAARLIHSRSRRRHKPFVTVECAALQESLLQSELFGHERGAFTGADRAKPGLFEVAHGGTIFLDEIGEVSQATQVKLLRVIDAGTFRRVGGTREIQVDIRMLAATNRDLDLMLRQGLFRQDLYFRLSTISLALPPLRARGADVDLLVANFVRLLGERFGVQRRVTPDAMALLRQYSWPGNVRELLHVVEAAVVVCDGPEIRPEHLPPALGAPPGVPTGNITTLADLPTLEHVERAHIQLAIKLAAGHRGNAARALGISERNLYRKLNEIRLEP